MAPKTATAKPKSASHSNTENVYNPTSESTPENPADAARSRRPAIPFYATASRRSPVIILAVDSTEFSDIDLHVERYVRKNYSVVVLVGDRFNAEPLLKDTPFPEYAAKISAQPAWAWCADNLPFARDVVFIP
jgi:hypothetical protein